MDEMSAVGQRPLACYNRDGSAADSRYQPCNPNRSGASMCCRTNDTAASFPDICRSDGFCQETQDTGVIWRESCTDSTWRAPECLQICVDDNDGSADTAVTFCSDGSLCCGRKNKVCCDAGRGVWRLGNTTTDTKPGSSSSSISSTVSPGSSMSSISSTASLSPAITSGVNSASPPASSSSLPTGAAIGIGVGIGSVAVITSVVLVFWARKKRKSREEAGKQSYQQPPASDSMDASKHGTEVDACKYGTELDVCGADNRPELAGTTVNNAGQFVQPQSPAELYGTQWEGDR